VLTVDLLLLHVAACLRLLLPAVTLCCTVIGPDRRSSPLLLLPLPLLQIGSADKFLAEAVELAQRVAAAGARTVQVDIYCGEQALLVCGFSGIDTGSGSQRACYGT
jgi:hypothetical protein